MGILLISLNPEINSSKEMNGRMSSFQQFHRKYTLMSGFFLDFEFT